MKKLLILPLTIFLMISCGKKNVDLIYTNVNGYTLQDDSLVTFNTLVVDNGKVLDIGDQVVLEKYSGEKIDGQGKTMLPGLIDAHGHVMGLGFQELEVSQKSPA